MIYKIIRRKVSILLWWQNDTSMSNGQDEKATTDVKVMKTLQLRLVDKTWMLDDKPFNNHLASELCESFYWGCHTSLKLYRSVATELAALYENKKLILELHFWHFDYTTPRVATFMFHRELNTIWRFNKKPIFDLKRAIKVSKLALSFVEAQYDKQNPNEVGDRGDYKYSKLLRKQGGEVAFDVRGVDRPTVQTHEYGSRCIVVDGLWLPIQIDGDKEVSTEFLQQAVDEYWRIGIVPMDGCMCCNGHGSRNVFDIECYGPKVLVK